MRPPPPRASWAYFFDIDGTLSELAPTPEAARMSPALRERIAALRVYCGNAVAVVSGRTLHDIDAMLAGILLPAAGQHGAERRDAFGRITQLRSARDVLDEAHEAVAQLAARHAGLVLEDKGHSLALHYRAAPTLAGMAHRFIRALQRRLGAAFTVQGGKRVVELIPTGTDKGGAVRAFLEEPPFRGRLPVFVGDDVSDEAAFAAVDRFGGHSIKVGAGHTTARWRLADVSAVAEWLTLPRGMSGLSGGHA